MNNCILANEAFPVNGESAPALKNESANPSGIPHTFDTGYAIAYGVEEAIMIRNFQHFITTNANRGHNFRDGRFWTYDRLEDFLNHFPYWSLQNVRRIIASLLNQEVIIKGQFNKEWSNRTQWYAFKDQDKFIRNIKVPKTPAPLPPPDVPKQANGDSKKMFADMLESTSGKCWDQHLANVGIDNCYKDTTAIATSITTTPSLKVSDPKVGSEAKASEDALEISSKSKKQKEKLEFSPQVREVASQMLAIIAKHNPVYRPPSDMEKFLLAVAHLVETEKQDASVLIKTFEWAVSDNEQRGDFKGWKGIVCTNKVRGRPTNPAEIFKSHLSMIYSQMSSRPKRKFAASSDQEGALEYMDEMNRTAI